MLRGIAVSKGIAIGRIKWYRSSDIFYKKPEMKSEDFQNEVDKFEEAIKICHNQIKLIQSEIKTKAPTESAIFDAYLLFLEDPLFVEVVKETIETKKITAKSALVKVVLQLKEQFEKIDDPYIKSRSADLVDISRRISNILDSGETSNLIKRISQKHFILAVEEIAPTLVASLDKEKVLGLISSTGNIDSHAAILARSLEIPAVFGALDLKRKLKNNQLIILDGTNGRIFLNPDKELIDNYKKLQLEEEQAKARRLALTGKEAKTFDGEKISLFANISYTEEAEQCLKYGAEGIGLFRTEVLFLKSSELPTEAEQLKIYREVLEKMKPRPVIFRVLDIGSDKPLRNTSLPREDNPALGVRGIRFLLKNKSIFKQQLRAILRASVFGNSRIMFPMINSIEEVDEVKRILREVEKELKSRKQKFSPQVKMGIMIETPSAVLLMDKLAKKVDFFSLGTNDLIQYTLAVDRNNKQVANIYQSYSPAVLSLIKKAVNSARSCGKDLSICGEMGSDLSALPILVGLGIRKLSLNLASFLEVKERIFEIKAKRSKKLAEKALQSSSAEEVKKLFKMRRYLR